MLQSDCKHSHGPRGQQTSAGVAALPAPPVLPVHYPVVDCPNLVCPAQLPILFAVLSTQLISNLQKERNSRTCTPLLSPTSNHTSIHPPPSPSFLPLNTPVQQLQPPQMLQRHLVSICRAHKVLSFNDTKSQTRTSISMWQHHPHAPCATSLKQPYSQFSTRPLPTGGVVQPRSVSILPLPGQSPAPYNRRKKFSLHPMHPAIAALNLLSL